LDGPHDAEAGVGDDDVDPAEALAGRAGHALEVAVHRHVARDRERLAPHRLDLAAERLQAVEAAGGQHEGGALARALARERGTDPRGGPRDQHALPGERAAAARRRHPSSAISLSTKPPKAPFDMARTTSPARAAPATSLTSASTSARPSASIPSARS